MKKVLVIVFLIMAVVCTQSFAKAAGEEKEYRCVFGSSGLGGTWHATACKMSSVAQKYEGLTIIVQTTGGGAENVRLMSQNQAQMGLVEPNIAAYAYRGTGMFNGEAHPEQRMVNDLYPNVACAVVRKDSDIKSLYDFDSTRNGGKKYGFSPGCPGSGDEYCWIEMLSCFDVTPEELLWKPSTHQERVTAFQDRILECIGYTTCQPSGSILEASAQIPIRIIEIKGEEREKVCKTFPWYAPIKIKAGLYNGQDEEVETIYIGGYVNAREDVPEEFIYKFLSAVFGPGMEEVQSVTAGTKDIKLENALGANKNQSVLPFHDGAIRFYKEKGMIK